MLRLSRRRLLSFAALAAGAALALAGCTPAGPGPDRITALVFSQSQAVPDFDTAEYVQNDPDEVARFIELLDEYDIDPATYRTPDTDGCAGGVTTNVMAGYSGTDLATQFSIDGCAADDDTFERDATALFSEWREQLADE
jgi:hypothetical protein